MTPFVKLGLSMLRGVMARAQDLRLSWAFSHRLCVMGCWHGNGIGTAAAALSASCFTTTRGSPPRETYSPHGRPRDGTRGDPPNCLCNGPLLKTAALRESVGRNQEAEGPSVLLSHKTLEPSGPSVATSHFGPWLVTSRCTGDRRSCVTSAKISTEASEQGQCWALTLRVVCQVVCSLVA